MVSKLIADACDITIADPNFKKDFIQLTMNELSHKKVSLTEEQVSMLLETAFLFALNRGDIFQKLAFKIAVYLLKQCHTEEYPLVPFAVELVLVRLGDLPTISSMVENQDGRDYFSYFMDEGYGYDSLTTYLRFPEILAKKVTNQVELSDKELLSLTNFQSKIYNLLKTGRNVAFSAPTSAGKSYVLHHFIAEQISRREKFSAVYVAPTKALIAEIQVEITKKINDFGVKSREFAVFNSISHINLGEINKLSKKVFVLTQERLQEAMANNPLRNVDLLVVDEAQKINDKSRGVIIEDAVQELLLENPSILKVFISPYIRNPQKCKLVFDVEDEVVSEKTSKSPVGQNILSVDFGSDKVSLSLFLDELQGSGGPTLIYLEELPVGSKLSLQAQRKAWVANNIIPSTEPTLIYCDRPVDCRRAAKYIAKGSQEESPLSQELTTAIKFFETFVHKDYYLCDALRYRIGYHYGKMPQFVRFYVKNLFENKHISRLCCTSTLLEGVNLPAKNIVLYNPKAGEVLGRLDLLNLAGRAGRLMMDYYGKIYCIDMKAWEMGEAAFESKMEEMESSAENTLAKDADTLIQYLQNVDYPTKLENVKVLATSLMVKQSRYPDSKFLENFRKRHKDILQADIDTIKDLLIRNASQLMLDKKVVLKNRTIDPRLQDRLYDNLRNSGFEAVPSPGEPDFYDKLLSIFKIMSRFLLRDESRSYVYYSTIAFRWILEDSYKALIEGKIKHGKRKPREKEKAFNNRMIAELDDTIETKLKYDYARALKCYLDITEEIMQKTGDKRLSCNELPIFLEAGASSKRVLVLLDMGFSRAFAIEIKNLMGGAEITSIADCVNWLRTNKDMIRQKLPPILYREIEDLLTEYSDNQSLT
jgi:hypothetical protein